MKYFKILPAAASIIALSATIGFSSEIREADDASAFRILVETRELKNNAEQIAAHTLPATMNGKSGEVYRVEINRGYTTNVVFIDIYTGKILGNTSGPNISA